VRSVANAAGRTDDHRRMRVLVTAVPGVGHLLPLLPIARAAQADGHDVVVGSGASLGPIVARAGARFAPLGPRSLDEIRASVPGFADLAIRERLRRMYADGFGSMAAEQILDDILTLAGSWRPDVIVHDDMEMGSWIAAERLEIPHVSVQTTAWRPAQRPWLTGVQNAIRTRHGLATTPELAGRDGAVWFATRPPSMRDPAAPLPDGARDLRPASDDRFAADGIDGPSAWVDGPTGRPRVAVTLGTVNAHRIDLLRPIVEGAASLDVDVVVGLGADPATLGPVPPNVRVEAYVPMSALLTTAAAVVHHGGAGTTMTALAAGRPMIVVPIAADQFENSQAAVRTGAAIELDGRSLTADRVAGAARRLLDEPSFTASAAAVAAEIEAMPDATAAWAAIAALA
jgi:UDP:flavonoid glycosyltransferase YjiC (YdhE family)